MAFFATWINAFRLAAAFFASLKRPDSVVGYHLSVLNITVGINLPTLYRFHLAMKSGEQPSPIVYVAFQHARFTRE
jgi:hypothetical protein